MKEPVRTCIVCRRKGGRRSLFRVVARDGRVEVDRAGNATGRGAYVHPEWSCISKMMQPERWRRALRMEGGTGSLPGLVEVYGELQASLNREGEGPLPEPGRKVRL